MKKTEEEELIETYRDAFRQLFGEKEKKCPFC